MTKTPKTEPAAKRLKTEPLPAPPETKAAVAPTPDRPVMGALIDPLGQRPVALTESEYQALRTHLTISRSEEHETLADFIRQALFLFEAEPNLSDEKALAWVVEMWMADHHDDTNGLLIPRQGPTVTVLENEGEYKVLESMLAVLRAGGWFAEWLKLQCHSVAEASTAADRYPSPLAIMSTLTEAIAEFEEQAGTVKEMVKLRPDLFPESKEVAPASERPAKAQRARKSRKVGHAKKQAA